MQLPSFLTSPRREYGIIAGALLVLIAHYALGAPPAALWVVTALGTVPVAIRGIRDILHLRVTIDFFNLFALGVSFALGELPSAAFIVLMITSADLLDWRTSRRSQRAVEQLLRLRPQTATRLSDGAAENIRTDEIHTGDVLVVKTGAAIPADGTVISGEGYVNEALVTGESVPVRKIPGSRVLESTILDTGVLQMRAISVGKDSTIARMARLIREAAANKSRPERLADRFAAIFLPVVLLFALGVYLTTRNAQMTAALLLVACADDMALAIPLAVTAALGRAARRGVVVKGGGTLDVLARTKTMVLDKTGTLTYGSFRIQDVAIGALPAQQFWRLVGTAEKFSEHPIGRALVEEAYRHAERIPDPDEVVVHKGGGIAVKTGGTSVIVGDAALLQHLGIANVPIILSAVGTTVFVAVNGSYAGSVTVADIPRTEAAASLRQLQNLGVGSITMFTGDQEGPAQHIAGALGITNVRSAMKPEDKLHALEQISARPVAMVGDGINDAPSLARADVGIAMGKSGAAISSEAADIVVLTDDLSRLPEIVRLSRMTMSVIRSDIALWAFTNAVGFWLVLTGHAGPAIAAFYNFATDFVPLLNSARLFRARV